MTDYDKPRSGKADKQSQTFFRVAYKNSIGLLQIADNKANMLISVNTLVISAIIAISGYGAIASQFENLGLRFLLPLGILLTCCLVSTILAVKAAKPRLILRDSKPYQPEKGSVLFFGDSSAMSLDAYLNEVRQVLGSKESVNQHLTVALYRQGLVLDRKYRLLGQAYSLFMVGIALGTVVFLAFMFF